MNFVAALKCGATPEVEAARCMNQLLRRSEAQGALCLALAADFINELYKAIGLETNINVQQLETAKFDWETTLCRHYVFHCNTIFFAAFERFLTQLSRTVGLEQLKAVESMTLQHYFEMLDVWRNCSTDLLKQDDDMQVQFLVEPLARINYILFLGAQKIRKLFDLELDMLNTICTYLLESALAGLFFEECHTYIAEGLSKVMEADFSLSKAFNEDAFKFFRLVFTQHKVTHSSILKCLTRMLAMLSRQQDTSSYRQFVSFLVEKDMQESYYTFLKLEKTTRILLATLDFLTKLQTHLLDLSCFSQTFLEAILALTLHTHENISLTAAELYIKMARRKASDDDYILKHILEFYFKEMTNADTLPLYVNALWCEFPYMQSMRIYLDLLKNATAVPLGMRYLIAQFTIVVYRKMLDPQVCGKYVKEFIHVFETLPTLFDVLNSQYLKGILLQLYSLTAQNYLCDGCDELNELLPNFEDYFVSAFRADTHLQYPYLYNLFAQFARCIEKTLHFDKLEMCAIHAYTEYEEVERLLVTKKSPSLRQSSAYCYILQKLSVLMQVDYNVFDQLEHIIQTLHVRLIETTQIHELADKQQVFIDIYATDLMVNGCIKLSRDKDLTNSNKMWLVGEMRILETYLLNFLSKAESKTNAQLYRVKTYFICLVNLYQTFHNSSGLYKLQLNLRSYHVLVETLLASCLQRKPKTQAVDEEHMELHPKYISNYQQWMFMKFTQLHSTKHIALPSPVAWKLCMHYGLSSHKFSDELFTFMEALTKYHFKIFTHISAVLVYNLYKQKPPFTTDVIQSVIRAQKSFIDQLPTAHTPALLCANVVLRVLQFLQQSLQKLPPTTGGNRLTALKHLNFYTHNLNVNVDNVLPDIRNQAKALQNHMLNNAEQMCLRAYLSALGVHTEINGKA
ncbi:uncharacterized protein LOC105208535 isoform X2 [Zeugodacus cucurbitae]|uniref:uncharacterized protein LOC105208535 isoform X2 n=1 Tax=Zeugodacus cucurbitae TaxID=28588 RepID=UPI0023D946C2|nr:uncharacterized protein LOC105208535 isoform X2 [Zeugodacus cucurbitae]